MVEIDVYCSECMHNKTCKYMDDYVKFGDKLHKLFQDKSDLNEPECANIQITCKYVFKKGDYYM